MNEGYLQRLQDGLADIRHSIARWDRTCAEHPELKDDAELQAVLAGERKLEARLVAEMEKCLADKGA